MKIDREMLRHIAETARLDLTESEIQEFLPQLREILSAFSQIKEVDTTGTKPSYHPVKLSDAMREDNPLPSISAEDALKNSIHKKDGYFNGPRVL